MKKEFAIPYHKIEFLVRIEYDDPGEWGIDWIGTDDASWPEEWDLYWVLDPTVIEYLECEAALMMEAGE